MTTSKPTNTREYLWLRSFTYFMRQALDTLEKMPPGMREIIQQVLTDCDLPQMRDLATLEKMLRKLTLRS